MTGHEVAGEIKSDSQVHGGSNRIERGVNLIKAADGLPWSTCEQGFVSRGEILYGILATSVVNKVVYTK